MLSLLAALLFSSARAEPTSADEEVTVFGKLQVEAARQQVIADLKAEGFTHIIEKDGRTILKNEVVYRGKIILHDDGWLEHRRQGVRGETPDSWFKRKAPALAWMPCIIYPHQCVRIGGVVISPAKLQHVKTDTYRAVARDLVTLSDRVADLNVAQSVNALPERLEACWVDGVSMMEEDAVLATPQARLLDLLAFMDSRTDNAWGDQVRGATASYLRGVVQYEVTPEQRDLIFTHLDPASKEPAP
jgi:hypothetical protein